MSDTPPPGGSLSRDPSLPPELPPRFGPATVQKGEGAAWTPRTAAAAAAPAAPTNPPEDTEWALRGLQAAQAPTAKGTFAGRSSAQWARMVERQTAAAAAGAAAPVLRLTPHQAADRLACASVFGVTDAAGAAADAQLAAAQAVVRGEVPTPSPAQCLALREQLAQLLASRPSAHAAVCRMLERSFGAAAAAQLQDPQALPPSLVSCDEAPSQAKLAAAALGKLSRADEFEAAELATAQAALTAAPQPPDPGQWGVLATFLLLARTRDEVLAAQLQAALCAVYGRQAAAAVATCLQQAPFSWRPPADAQPATWVKGAGPEPCTFADVVAHFRAGGWPA